MKNQKGVTILEVVIAVAILLALSIPVTRAVVAAAKYQYKSRIRQDLTIVAESLMENFKGYTIEEMESKFRDSLSDYTDGGESSFAVNKNEDNSYSFEASNIKIDDQLFDITSKVEAVEKYDQLTLTGFNDFDTKTCAYGLVTHNQTEAKNAVLSHFEAQHLDNFLQELNSREEVFVDDDKYTREDIDFSKIHLLERNISVTIFEGDGRVTVSYAMTYSYDLRNYPYNVYEIKTDPVTKKEIKEVKVKYFDYGSFTFTAVNGETFYNEDASGNLKRVYFYYYPVYINSVGDSVKDNLKFTNNTWREIDVYLLKQRDEGLGLSVETYEQGYCPYVTHDGYGLKIFHNLGVNIANQTAAANDYWKYRVSGFFNEGKGEPIEEALKKEDNTLLYNITIEIKKDDEIWSTLSGTIKE